ncbi:hypothetical protein [Paraburkholderia metrosideri]|jgi:SUMO ligase MMS21 Smc5/6 complex component|uniref:Uncharacterized protein n=1 Tax=Paraburkholderia metrosideri TaxID=580937 RepID=A0ABN7HG46_9BURK|nr:hypothetical protein [Paraburkholderia metrosideri]CAD6516929.1 hypothetical protein LMG28140_00862 [Paraburkholderia metrosideri]
MTEASAGESAEHRHLAAAVVENACIRAIGACIDMVQAAQTISADQQLADVREALVRLQAAAKTARVEAKRMLDG